MKLPKVIQPVKAAKGKPKARARVTERTARLAAKAASLVAAKPLPTRAARMVQFIQRYVYVPEGYLVGRPMTLLPEQTNFITDVYGRLRPDGRLKCRRGILSTARKNGKTGLIAALALGHTVGPEQKPNSNVYSAARSRDQASLVFNYATKSLRMNPRLEGLVQIRDSAKVIVGLQNNVTYKALSKDATTAHGLNPAVSIHDELGQVVGDKDPLYDALETAGGAQAEPLSLIISTQAPSDGDLLSVLIDDGINNKTEETVVHLYCADKEDDIFEEDTWRKANFAYGKFRSEEEFREAAARAKRMPSFEQTFRNLYLNQRIARAAIFMPPTVWKACTSDVDMGWFLDGRPVHVGIDLSQRTDLTSAVLACTTDEGRVALMPLVFTPLIGLEDRAKRDRAPYVRWHAEGLLQCSPGTVINYDWVVDRLAEHTDGMNIVRVGFDRWRIDLFKTHADRIGWAVGAEWEAIGQGFKDMTPRLELFEALALSCNLVHNGHAVLNMAASNAVAVSDAAGNRKLEKAKSTARIDPLVAAVMAIPVEAEATDESPIFML